MFEGGRTVGRTLQSLASAPPEWVRIMISDNASTDATEAICRSFAEGRSNVTYVRQPLNIGMAPNAFFLLEQSTTPYFMWLAADDWLDDGFLAAAVAFLDAHPNHTLVTAPSAYYAEKGGAYELTTSCGSFEEEEPSQRVLSFVAQLTDNSEFYGVYRRSVRALNVEPFAVIGADWVAMVDSVFVGKLKALPGFAIHRENRWGRADRWAEVIAGVGAPPAQAKAPHYATALFLLLHIAVTSDVYGGLGAGARMRLAFRSFTLFQALQQLPKALDFWQHLRLLFEERAGNEMGHRFRVRLSELVLAWAEGGRPEDVLQPSEAIAIATTLRMRGQPESEQEHPLRARAALLLSAERTRVASLAVEMAFEPAWRLPMMPSLSELPVDVWTSLVAYGLETVAVFADDADVEAYVDHQERMLTLIENATTMGVVPLPQRIAPDRARILNEFLQGWSAMSTLFSGRNLKPIMEKRDQLVRMLLGISGVTLDHVVPRRARDRRRVGLLVSGLHSLTDTYTSLPAITHLDPKKFERVVFTIMSGGKDGTPTPMERYVGSVVDRIVVLTGNVNAMAATVRAEQLDYLLYGSNVSLGLSPLLVLASHRLARHQIAFNPSCMTTGIKNVDWFVSGRTLEPADAQEHYTERLLLLDGPGHVRAVPPFERPIEPPRAGLGRAVGPTRFVSGANYYKLTPGVRRAWMQLLARVPGATLSLYPFGPAWSDGYDSDRLLRLLERDADRAGVADERLSISAAFATVADMKRFLGMHDVYLDSFPFSGINSVLDPLTCGLPVVSLRGTNFRSRMGASALEDLGLEGLVGEDVEGYLAIAERLGKDPAQLRLWRNRIRGAIAAGKSKLWDSQWCSAEFARLFDEMEARTSG